MSTRMNAFANGAIAVSALLIAGVTVSRQLSSSAVRGAPARMTAAELPADLWKGMRLTADSPPPAIGPVVTIAVVADLECPYCARFHRTIRAMLGEIEAEVQFVFIHFPLPNHRFAAPAARLAECARREERFDRLTDVIYSKQDSLGLKSWSSYASEAGVDTVGLESCMSDPSIASRIAHDSDLARAAEVTGTPTVVVNGWRLSLPPSKDQLLDIVRDLRSGVDPKEVFGRL